MAKQENQSAVKENPAIWRVKRVFKSADSVLYEVQMANYPFGTDPWAKAGDYIQIVPKKADK